MQGRTFSWSSNCRHPGSFLFTNINILIPKCGNRLACSNSPWRLRERLDKLLELCHVHLLLEGDAHVNADPGRGHFFNFYLILQRNLRGKLSCGRSEFECFERWTDRPPFLPQVCTPWHLRSRDRGRGWTVFFLLLLCTHAAMDGCGARLFGERFKEGEAIVHLPICSPPNVLFCGLYEHAEVYLFCTVKCSSKNIEGKL